jgi:hypothetical protein
LTLFRFKEAELPEGAQDMRAWFLLVGEYQIGPLTKEYLAAELHRAAAEAEVLA